MFHRKKLSTEKNSFFAVDYVKIIELHIVHTWHANWVDEVGDVMMSIKKINKN